MQRTMRPLFNGLIRFAIPYQYEATIACKIPINKSINDYPMIYRRLIYAPNSIRTFDGVELVAVRRRDLRHSLVKMRNDTREIIWESAVP